MRLSRFLSDRSFRPRQALFCVAFFLLSVSVMIERSTLVELPNSFANIISIVAAVMFGAKFLLDKHKGRELLISIMVIAALVIMRILGAPVFMVTSGLAFLAIKDVNIRTIIKIDIAVKSFFLLSHGLLFLVDYMTGMDTIWEYISVSSKGTAASLYFKNPNTTGLIATWIALGMLYLKDQKKLKDFVLPTIIVVVTFMITTSRAPFLVYLIYLLLQLVRNGQILYVMQRIVYPIFCIGVLLIVNYMPMNGAVYEALNSMSSGRIGYSLMAYDAVGVNFLPSHDNEVLLDDYIIDVFYVKCLVEYGVITMIIYYLPYWFLPRKCKDETKRIAIITAVYLFLERAVANVGFALPYLIMADAIFNGNTQEKKRKDQVNA